MDIFALIKKLYQKKPIKYEEIKNLEIKECITMMNFLTQDVDILDILKKAIGYLFVVSPAYFYIYLYCQIPKKANAPFLRIPKRAEKNEKDDELFRKMKYVMGWGDNELQANKKYLEKIINLDREHFEERLGIESKKEKKK